MPFEPAVYAASGWLNELEVFKDILSQTLFLIILLKDVKFLNISESNKS